MWLVYGRLFSFVSWEAVGDGLAMLVGSVLGKPSDSDLWLGDLDVFVYSSYLFQEEDHM